MKNDRSIDLGLIGYEELFMSTEERLDAKKPKVEAIPLADLMPFRNLLLGRLLISQHLLFPRG